VYYVIIIIILLSRDVLASEVVLTKCKPISYAYVNIEPFNADRSFFKSKPTNFKSDKSKEEEEYWLTYNDKLPLKYNIHYKCTFLKNNDWDVANDAKIKNAKYFILNNGMKNLVLNLIYQGYQQQTYYFNLDDKGNGYMSMVNTRWSSVGDIMNDQSLYFHKCKGVKQ
tara:strand:+ start:81 stop:584 length:504 start_codon:yes stop_codon:yes gene_type:complete